MKQKDYFKKPMLFILFFNLSIVALSNSFKTCFDTTVNNIIKQSSSPLSHSILTCNDDAGQLDTYIDGVSIQNNVINYVNYNSTIQFVHSGGNASQDGDLSTLPGFDIAIYNSVPPLSSGPTAADIHGDLGFSGGLVGTSINGNHTFTNLGYYQNTFNVGDPIHLWFAPITLDDHANKIITENPGASNECVNVSTSEKINMVFLNSIDTFQFTNPTVIGGSFCTARMRITGGLPEWDASHYNINIHLTGHPTITATISPLTPIVQHFSLLEFTVPQSGYYDINISDNNGASRTFTVLMDKCPTSCNSFALEDSIMCSNDSLIINGTTYNQLNSTGVETISNGSYQGCDSIIHINLSFDNSIQLVSKPTNIQQFITSGSCQKNVNWIEPIVQDACGIVLYPITQSHQPNDWFNVGTTTITYVYDNYGDSLTTTFDVSIVDTIKPSFLNCPNDTIVSCSDTVTWLPLSATDNCGNINIISTHQSGSVFSSGTTDIFYYVHDGNGNYDTCHFVVLVKSNSSSIIDSVICITDSITINGIVYNQQNPTGSQTISNGNIQGCDSIIQVNLNFYETTPILISSPNNIQDFISSSSCQQVVNWIEPVVIDSCGTVLYPISQSHQPNDSFNIGTTTITYVYDNYGDSLTTTFDVSIVDTIKPSFLNCPNDTIVSCSDTVTWLSLSATDNCGNINIISTHQSGSVFSSGATDVFYYVHDGNGNYDTCQFTVLVVNQPQIIIDTSAVTCFGDSNGIAIITALSGQPPFTFALDTNFSQTLPMLNNLVAGSYSLTITDGYNCSFDYPFTIPQPDSLITIISTIPDTNSLNTGQISIDVTGGVGPYVYQWDSSSVNSSLDTTFNLGAGAYYITVTDANGCVTVNLVVIDSLITSLNELDRIESLNIFPNPASNHLFIDFKLDILNDVSISLYDASGRFIQNYGTQSTSKSQLQIDIPDLPSGIYFIQLMIDNQIINRKIVIHSD